MELLLEALAYPFMQRAVIAGAVLGVLLAGLGVFMTLRKMSFFGEGIAHASLAGISIALLAGAAPIPVAVAWAVAVAVLIYAFERSTRLPSDTLIGIFFTASMAIGVILMSYTQGYQPELLSYLFGSILGIRSIDVIVIVILSVAILVWLALSYRQLTLMSLSEDTARVAGIPVERQTLAFYITLAIATVLGVKVLGIVLVSAILIIPAAISRLFAGSFRSYIMAAILVSEVIILSGLMLSFALDWPSGATIVLVGAALFFLAAVISPKR